MILNLRGTCGSGKTHTAKGLLDAGSCEELHNDAGKLIAYRVQLPELRRAIYVLGRYNIPTGGLDTIKPIIDVCPLLTKYAALGHVFLEGLFFSSSYGAIGKFTECFGNEIIFAYLDTPLERCIEQVKLRRLKRGSTEEYSEKTRSQAVVHHRAVLQSKERIERVHNRTTVFIDHKNALQDVLAIFHFSENT